MGNTIAGRLYVYDQFGTQKTGALHGDAVVAAARNEGLAADQIVNHQKNKIEIDGGLYTKVANKKDYDAAFKKGVVGLQKDTLEDATSELQRLKKDGVHDSAANFSMGMSKASVADVYFKKMSLAWDSNDFKGSAEEKRKAEDEALALVDNFARMHGTTADHVIERMAVPKSEGAKSYAALMKQTLAKEVDQALQGDTVVAGAKKTYDQAVVDFEKDHNSVVVAAENSGEIRMRKGEQIEGLYDNVLSSAATTTVGATNAQGTAVESYSNPSKNVSIYARGQSPIWSNPGTSFAAPRVAAAMAKAHQLNQKMESEEVERQVLDDWTTAGPGGRGVQLDSTKDKTYFSQN